MCGRLCIAPTTSRPGRRPAAGRGTSSIDTGMARAGVRWDRGRDTRPTSLRAHPPEGVFTHFHSAEVDDGSRDDAGARASLEALASLHGVLPRRCAHAFRQQRRHRRAVGRFAGPPRTPGHRVVRRHDCPGAAGSDHVVHLRARIVDLRDVHDGESVSYGATWTATGERRIATVARSATRTDIDARFPIAARRLVHGVSVSRSSGTVTMDMTMLDVTALGDRCHGRRCRHVHRCDGGDCLRTDDVAAFAGPLTVRTAHRTPLASPRLYRAWAISDRLARHVCDPRTRMTEPSTRKPPRAHPGARRRRLRCRARYGTPTATRAATRSATSPAPSGGCSSPIFSGWGWATCRRSPVSHPVAHPIGAWGTMLPRSAGKDSTTGHWEIAGLHLEKPFPTYPQGFPPDVLAAFTRGHRTRPVIANTVASGTAVIADFAEQQQRTGAWIVYTSADSVFQIAAHEEWIPLAGAVPGVRDRPGAVGGPARRRPGSSPGRSWELPGRGGVPPIAATTRSSRPGTTLLDVLAEAGYSAGRGRQGG